MVDVFCQPCKGVPCWIYSNQYEYKTSRLSKTPLEVFTLKVLELPAAKPSTIEQELLRELWDEYKSFNYSLRSIGQTNLYLNNKPIDEALTTTQFQQLVEFLQSAIQYTDNSITLDNPHYNHFVQEPDFYLPLWEFAPSHINFLIQQDGPLGKLNTEKGLFNLLVFHILCYNTEASWTYHFNFDNDTLEKFRQHHN